MIGIGLSAAVAGVPANLIIGAALLGVSMLLAPRPPVMKTPQERVALAVYRPEAFIYGDFGRVAYAEFG